MPTPRVAMRKIKECLRLKLDCGLSHERIALALGLSKGAVSKYVARAAASGLDWPTLSTLSESVIAAKLGVPPQTVRGERAPIDLLWVHRELRRKGVTRQLLWQEYCDANVGRPCTSTPSFASIITTMPPRCDVRCASYTRRVKSCLSITPVRR